MVQLNQIIRLNKYSRNFILNGLARVSVDKDGDIIVVRYSLSMWLCALDGTATVQCHTSDHDKPKTCGLGIDSILYILEYI